MAVGGAGGLAVLRAVSAMMAAWRAGKANALECAVEVADQSRRLLHVWHRSRGPELLAW